MSSALYLPIADSSITSKISRCSVVMTADCLPILVSSQEGCWSDRYIVDGKDY